MPEPSSKNREGIINDILHDLRALEPSYAVDANIHFFEAARSYPKYLHWLTSKARKLDGSRLLEINDILTRFDAEMHHDLIAMERRNFPGLIKPLVVQLTMRIMEYKKNPCIVANMGCGGMEVERQVIQVLQAKQHPGCVLFVGIDQSPVAHAIAKENLHTLGSAIVIEEYERLDREYLKSAVMSSQQTYSVILAKNDVFKLHEEFHGCLFDIAFSSLFKHHLPPARKDEFDQTLAAVAKRVLEYDGYKSWGVMIPQTLTTWKSPVLLNGTIFSDLRYHTKKELKKKAGGHKISFTKIGTYLMEK